MSDGGLELTETETDSGRGQTEFPDTPAGARANTVMGFLAAPGAEIDFADVDAVYHPDLRARWPREDEDTRRERWSSIARLESATDVSPHVVQFSIAFAGGRPWVITMTVEPEPPHRVIDEFWEQTADVELVVRAAVPEDAPALAELDRIAPIVQGDALVSFDRGADYFANARLLEHAVVAVAEIDGRVAGVNWGAVHRRRVAGIEHRLATALHLRVHPDAQGKGVWGSISNKLWEFFRSHQVETSYAFVHRDNVAVQRGFSMQTSRWSVPAVRAIIPCASAARMGSGRPATPADAARVVDILNATHAGEEMYLPYTVGSLTARLTLAPELYSWDDLWIDGDAVVGVWPAGLRVMRDEAGVRTESVRALVADYGCLPGAEHELERLFRQRCAHVADRSMTDLTFFTWHGAPSFATATALGASFETFDLFLFNIAEPGGLAEHGLYVDQLYM